MSIEIKKNSNISLRTITWDVYINGEYIKTFHDILDAQEFVEGRKILDN